LEEATEVIQKAEHFVKTVERVFGLEETYQAAGFQDHKPDHDDKISEPSVAKPFSLEEERRQARENWLRLRRQQIQGESKIDPGRDGGCDANDVQSRSLDDDLDE
jgi:hypothetical protein